jgi:hypothetical protein
VKLFTLVIITIFSSSCYSADWGICKLNSYFYTSPIKDIEVFFHSTNKLAIDFERKNNYWGISLFKINKGSSNELLKKNSLSSSQLSIEKLVYENYRRLLEQDLFHVIKNTETFSIPTVPIISGYSISAMFDSKIDETADMLNFSIAVQEYEEYILFTKIVVSGNGELPSVSDVKEVVLQFRNSCFIQGVEAQ